LRGIVAGPDGNLYYTKPSDAKIGRITTSGEVTEFNTPSASAFPTFLTVGADGNIWFSEGSPTVNNIAVLVLRDQRRRRAVRSEGGGLRSAAACRRFHSRSTGSTSPVINRAPRW
jgi:hypothetical protein